MAEKEKKEGLGISGFTLGIISLAFPIAVIFFGLLGGVVISTVGFILCLIQQKRHKIKLGKIGIILNIIGFLVNLALWIALLVLYLPTLNTLPTA